MAERMADNITELGDQYQQERPLDVLAAPGIPERDDKGRPIRSRFQQMEYLYNHYLKINSDRLSDPDQQRLQDIRAQFKEQIQNRVDEAASRGILDDMRVQALKFYNEVRATRRHEREGGRSSRQQEIDRGRRMYNEIFWDRTAKLSELQADYEGVAEYVWEGIVDAIHMDENKDPSEPLNPIGKEEFQKIKEQREEQRLKQKKYYTVVYFGQSYDILNWPEKAEDFPVAASDWVKDKIYHLHELGTDLEAIDNAIREFRKRGVDLVDSRRLILNEDEGLDISERDPQILRGVSTVEAVMDAMGYEAIIYKGGEEYATKMAERYGTNYVFHEEAIRLENPKVAYIELKLRQWKDKEHRGHDESICKGGTYWTGHPWDVEKALEGPIADYRRQQAEEEIIEDAQLHDLYINAISKKFFGIEDAFKYRLGKDPQHPEQNRDLRYSFEDNIERLLLDPDNQIWNQLEVDNDIEVFNRHKLRVGVFRRIKQRWDGKDGFVNPDGSLMTEEQRRVKVRQIILDKMREKTGTFINELSRQALDFDLDHANATEGTVGYDRVLWKWVQDYNEYKLKLRLPRFFPTSWDRVRWGIDRPTRVIDRLLTDDELDAMYEPIPPPEKLDYNDPAVIDPMNDARFAFQLARAHMILKMEDVILGGIRYRDIDPQTGQYRDPQHKVKRVFDTVQENLEKAIKDEEAWLNPIRAAWRVAEEELRAAKASGDPALIDQKKTAREGKYLAWIDAMTNANFLATHALKEAGLVEGKLPVWSQNFIDPSTIEAYTETLADYGVHVAYGVPISHNDKKEIYETIERGRRAWEAENARAAENIMDGTWPVFQEDEAGEVVVDEQGNPKPAEAFFMAARDFWDPDQPIIKRERFRVVSKGAVRQHRQIADARYELSTSGGMRVPELNSVFGNLGYCPPYIKMGLVDARGEYGFLKRRDEVEFHEHKFLDTMDPIHDARERRAAYTAYKALTGGLLGEGHSTPGQLKEPFKGAYQTADYLQEQFNILETYKMYNTYYYLLLMQEYRKSDMLYSQFIQTWQGKVGTGPLAKSMKGEDLEKLRQLSYADLPKASKVVQDGLYEKLAGGTTYLRDYFQAEDPVENQRAGIAFGTLAYDNWVKFVKFREEARKAMQRREKTIVNGVETEVLVPERGFVIRLGYAPEIASEISMAMQDIVLADDFKIPRPHERKRLAQQGALMKAKGFEEQLRVSGLQLFMDEEGYQVVDTNGKRVLAPDGKPIEVLGRKIPQLVREQMVGEDPTHKKLVHPT